MRAIACIILTLTLSAATATAAPAPFPRPVRPSQGLTVDQVKQLFKRQFNMTAVGVEPTGSRVWVVTSDMTFIGRSSVSQQRRYYKVTLTGRDKLTLELLFAR